MAQLFPRVFRATIGASALAAAMGLQPLTAAPAPASSGRRPAAKDSVAAKRQGVQQDGAKADKPDKADKADKADKKDKGDQPADEPKNRWTKTDRSALIKRAAVWSP